MGDDWTGAKFTGDRQTLVVARLRDVERWRIAPTRDVPERLVNAGLHPPLAALDGERLDALCGRDGVIETACQEQSLALEVHEQGEAVPESQRRLRLDRALDRLESCLDSSRPDQRVTEECTEEREYHQGRSPSPDGQAALAQRPHFVVIASMVVDE